ncbi:MAG: GDP-mannose 4,6-dehydratase, partial [Candidatus Helarchaeota archaeon]
WKDYVRIDKRYMRPVDVRHLRCDFTKAKKKFGWQPKTEFNELVSIMVEKDLERWQRWKNGEHFPWDAQNYPNERKVLSRKLKFDE